MKDNPNWLLFKNAVKANEVAFSSGINATDYTLYTTVVDTAQTAIADLLIDGTLTEVEAGLLTNDLEFYAQQVRDVIEDITHKKNFIETLYLQMQINDLRSLANADKVKPEVFEVINKTMGRVIVSINELAEASQNEKAKAFVVEIKELMNTLKEKSNG